MNPNLHIDSWSTDNAGSITSLHLLEGINMVPQGSGAATEVPFTVTASQNNTALTVVKNEEEGEKSITITVLNTTDEVTIDVSVAATTATGWDTFYKKSGKGTEFEYYGGAISVETISTTAPAELLVVANTPNSYLPAYYSVYFEEAE